MITITRLAELIDELGCIESEIDAIESRFYAEYTVTDDARLESLWRRLDSIESELKGVERWIVN